LVPFVVKEKWVGTLAGLSLKNIEIRLQRGDRLIYSDFGEMLFTHFGVSGPVILSASAHVKQGGEYALVIDLKPALSAAQLDKRILRDFGACVNKNFSNALDALLPRKLIPAVVALSKIAPDTKVHQITAEQRARLTALLKNLPMTVAGTRPVSEAIITAGGVRVSEINPSTMESKLVKGLFFAGEVIDTDAYTGGFNLQIAYSTGYLAAEHV
jgi:predicted Rossmann fold flavoprotein